jgi:Ca-activated chloride channel family protein
LTVTASGIRAAGNEDKSHAPYFFVRGDDIGADKLPLKSSEAKVNIAGVIADVQVTQVYKNEGDKTLEAIYIFPASTRAAVYGMTMTIGERTIHAEIQKREAARKAYESAKNAGKTASLLEQQRPNVFQMNVANILPSDVIEVKLRYTELLVPTNGVYEFIYPTVVGPRFVEGTEGHSASSDGWTANPYLHQGDMPSHTFDISVNVAAGLPIQEITCPSHKTNITFQGPDRATIITQNQHHLSRTGSCYHQPGAIRAARRKSRLYPELPSFREPYRNRASPF